MANADRVVEPGQAAVSDQTTSAQDSTEDKTVDQTAVDEMETENIASPEADTNNLSHRFECRSCSYVYDPDEGVKKIGIPSGTAFKDLDPTSFRCPVCRSRTAAFKDIGPRAAPSGFGENLNYGFGVNRLTPGQKNVLIFGGMALVFAFFLSLYSLR